MQQSKESAIVFTGAGISAESGISTFRDSDGLWQKVKLEEVATPQAWQSNPEKVLDFYNARRSHLENVEPNAAHIAIAELERYMDVTVVTQNIDDLHERAGSTDVVHLHGELKKVRSSTNSDLIYERGFAPVKLGDLCEQGSQLRPHVVWFGEAVLNFELSRQLISRASHMLIVGTSLSVFPAADLVHDASASSIKVLVDKEIDMVPPGYHYIQGSATENVPLVIRDWTGRA